MPRYDASRIEPKWQAHWDAHATFQTPGTPRAEGGKLYVLDMFPYPSGNGLHVGHPEGYTATDIVCRYSRMKGKHVLHPMGWDAFGLPAEQHAIKTGVHPAVTTRKNIDTFRRQLKMLGFSYDWSREFSTTDPDYYRWTQWIFLQLFDTWYDPAHEWTGPDGVQRTGKGRPIAELPIPDDVTSQGSDAVRRYQDAHRLAYQHEAPVNWCAALGTVLANEEVIDGKSERGGHPVTRLPLRQWMLRITAYAERLIDELEPLDWSDGVKHLQRNWIGRSTGAEVEFAVAKEEGETRKEDGGRGTEDGSPATLAASPSGGAQRISIRVYTTRPDTLFGATYMVLSPEHELVESLTTPEQKSAVEAYQRQASFKSDLERTELAKEKTGVFTGSYAVNPVNGERIPIWIADYVLATYGTGAIMSVPAHDERDLEFAQKFQLPIRAVVHPPNDADPIGFTGEGTAINSGDYNGLPTAEMKQRIIADLEAKGVGIAATNYKLRDWLFSRQHFWGEPFPLWHELDADGKPTGLLRTDETADLPVTLPENFEFKPHGRPEPPLDEAPESWLYKAAADGTKLKRETNSMPQWAGSCWYYLRFADPKNGARFIDPELEKYWLPVDLYIGGAEHAVLHLLYSRFWHKVLFDRGHVSTPEPFAKLVNQGMILGEPELTAYRRESLPGLGNSLPDSHAEPAGWVSARNVRRDTDPKTGLHTFVDDGSGMGVVAVKLLPDQVEKRHGDFVLKGLPDIVVDSHAAKMSKSRGNVINPDDIVREYGSDSLRLYEMFMGPLEATKPWQMSGVEGVYRFLARVWRMIADEAADELRLNPAVQDAVPTEQQDRLLHKTIKSVTEDIDRLSCNTAISRMMEFVNGFAGDAVRPKNVCETFVLILSPFAPHLAEELWSLLGHTKSLAYEPWPQFDEAKIAESTVEIPVQVNGKLRGKVRVPADADKATLETAARDDAAIAEQLAGKQVVKVVAVPGRMVNFVVKG